MSTTMTNNNLNVRDYRDVAGNVEAWSEAIREKQQEVAAIEKEIAEAENNLMQLQDELKTASRDMAIGRLSTDRFLDLKRGIKIRAEDLEALKEVKDVQKKAIDLINADLGANKRAQNTLFKKIAEDLTGQFADEIAALAGEQIGSMVRALVASKGSNRAFTLQEQQREREAIYAAFGEELCNRLFQAGGSINHLPDFGESKKHVADLIDRLV